MNEQLSERYHNAKERIIQCIFCLFRKCGRIQFFEGRGERENPWMLIQGFRKINSGDVLLSHLVSEAVPSAQ
jgi:hypothetical protein